MPLPTPNKGENQRDFADRCMADPVMVGDFSDTGQRYAVCSRQWDDAHKAGNAVSWYEVRDAADGATEIRIYDQIGRGGIPARNFLDSLDAVKTNVINLRVNSEGGGVDDGIAMYNAIKEHPARVNGIVDGLAASIASVILQACDTRTMMAGSSMMIHDPYSGVDSLIVGNAADLRGLATAVEKQAVYLDKMGDTIAELYAARAGGDAGDWRTRMQDETWYRAQEAVDAGLADGVVAAKASSNRAFNLAAFKKVPDWIVQPAVNAGRTMSQANLDRVHGVMQEMGTIHSGTCDMGDNCPLTGSNTLSRAPLRAIAAVWDTAYINNLPDAAFAYIAPGGQKDSEGKTEPRSLRYLPHHTSDGSVDLPHLRNALSRAPQTSLPAEAKAAAIRHLEAHARSEGVGQAA